LGYIKVVLRFVVVIGLVAYFLAAAALLVTRYWVLPRVNEWRPEIEQALSEAAGVPIKVETIDAQWYGINATLELKNLRIYDAENVAQLGIPEIEVIVSWRSLLQLEPVFRYVGVNDLVLVARRNEHGVLSVGGFALEQGQESQGGFWQSPTMRWLLQQGRINIVNARVIWVDQMGDAIPMIFDDIDLTASNGLLTHRIDAKVKLPHEWGGEFELGAKIDSVENSLSNLLIDEPQGQIFASISSIVPARLSNLVDMPHIEGDFAARVWVGLRAGKFTTVTLDVAGRDANYADQSDATALVRAQRFQTRLSGPLAFLQTSGQWDKWVYTPRSPMQFAATLSLENGRLRGPAPGMADILADQLSLDLAIDRHATQGLQVRVNDAALASADGLVTARGTWSEGTRNDGGDIDMEGTVGRFQIASLHNYLPDAMNQDARIWLRDAFSSGIVSRAGFKVQGELDKFPFAGPNAQGLFQVDGTFQNLDLNYVPHHPADQLPWPPLADLQGSISLLGDRISARVNGGALKLPEGGARIALEDVGIDLIDLAADPLLTVKGSTQARAEAFLALFQQTALRDIAPAFVREFKGEGAWSMPLTLRVPLHDLEATRFKGELKLNGGSLAYAHSPSVTDIQGSALLSEKGFESKDLSGKLLGGAIKLDGGVSDQLKSLIVEGDLEWAQLGRYLKTDLIDQLVRGSLPYEVLVEFDREHINVDANSALMGTAIALPPPFGKSANQGLGTSVRWRSAREGAPESLHINVGQLIEIRGLGSSRAQDPHFSDVSIQVGQAQALAGGGLTAAVKLPSVDVNQWIPVIESIERNLNNSDHSTAPGPFPPFRALRLQTDRLTYGQTNLDALTADLTVSGATRYALALSSTQAKGSVNWTLTDGKLQDGFVANLAYLRIEDTDQRQRAADGTELPAQKTGAELPEPGSLSNLPALNITIDDLFLHGSRLGKLQLVGRNSANRHQWNIQQLRLTTPHAELFASGACRYFENPGLELAADLKISNLGDLTTFMTEKNPVRNGAGTITAKIDWLGMPWDFNYAGMSGYARIDLTGGVFDHINSSAARVLELLSLQSLSRLFSFDANPDDTFAKGFPWNSIDGDFDISKGVVDTRNLQVNSPVATISLRGGSNLVGQTWDLTAVVRPNLDLSGTALATGFLVNPLVGLSALIGQYVLRNPIEHAISQTFTVTGPWQNPVVNGQPSNDAPTPKQAPTNNPESRPKPAASNQPSTGAASSANPAPAASEPTRYRITADGLVRTTGPE
jgi:uncharacterized protein YhdP